jgi:predicted ribonuclease YlaK
MTKTYILDTNVLLSDSNSLFGFEEHDLVLPLIVLEELDRHKDRQDEVGRNAREVVRKLADLTKVNKDFKAGVPLGNKLGILRILSIEDLDIEGQRHRLPPELEERKSGDNTIAQFCINYALVYADKTVVLVTRDTILRLKAQAIGVTCEDYRKFNVAANASSLYSGVTTIEREDVVVQDFYSETPFYLPEDIQNDLFPNQFVVIKSGQQSAVGKFVGKGEPLKKIQKTASKLTPRNKEQEFAKDLLFDPDIKLVTLSGKAGTGKAQPLNAKILTPTGWTTMGQIKQGDYVIAQNGKPTKVTGVFPQGIKDIYKITFSDGSTTHCCEDHLWLTQTVLERSKKQKGTVKSLKDIMTNIKKPSGKSTHFIPMVEPVQFQTKNVPIDPYLLGLLIGDGGFSNHVVGFTSADQQLIQEVQQRLPKDCILSKKNNAKYDYAVKDKRSLVSKYEASTKAVLVSSSGEKYVLGSTKLFCEKYDVSPSGLAKLLNGTFKQIKGWTLQEKLDSKVDLRNNLVLSLERLGLMGHLSYDKFVPDLYKYNNPSVRLGVLQGLMDTDGTVSKNGYGLSFATSSETLANDMQELVMSFGGKATVSTKQPFYTYKGIKKQGHISYVLHISLPTDVLPFKLERKAKLYKPRSKYVPTRSIKNIELIGSEHAQCISVEDSEHLYVTDDYIVTHNTLCAIDAGIEQILSTKRYRSLVICRPVMPVGKDIGFLPGTLSEKLDPWLAPIKDNLRFLLDAQANTPATSAPTGSRRARASAEEKTGKSKFDEQILQSYFDEGIIEVQALTFIRGRSISNAFIVIDECFPGNQTVIVEGNRQMSFSALYSLYSTGKELPKAKSYNESTKSFEWRQILNVKNNGVKDVMRVRLGNRQVDVTKNHRFMTKVGWKEAQNLSVGDLILATETHKHQMLYDLSDEQEQVMIGSYLGDGHVSAHGPSRYRLRVIHGAAQTKYALWKASLLQGGTSSVGFIAKNGYAQNPAVSFCTKMYGSQLPFSVKKTKCDDALIAKIDARALAIWFMDDGSTVQGKFNAATLWTCSFDHESNLKLCKMLEERFQIQCRAQDVNASHAYRHIVLTASGYRRLCEVIAPWVHDSMAYKIHPDYHNLIGSGTSWQGVDGWITDHNLIAVDEVVLSSTSAVEVFDMEVEGNHNYVVSGKSRVPVGKASGFVVHNCQNTSLHEIKTILTRVGENTKIVLTGDVEQIDSTYVDSVSNGLSVVIEKFKNQKIAGHVTFTKGERSLLATLASDVLG